MLNLCLLSVVTLCFACSNNGYAVLAHQPASTTVAHVQTDLFSTLGHSWAAMTAQAEA